MAGCEFGLGDVYVGSARVGVSEPTCHKGHRVSSYLRHSRTVGCCTRHSSPHVLLFLGPSGS
jgi:hypothetical protein